MLLFQFNLALFFPVSTNLLSMFEYLFLPCKWVCNYSIFCFVLLWAEELNYFRARSLSYFFDISPKWSFVLFAYLGIDSVPIFYYEETQVMWVLLEDRVPPIESEEIRNSVTLSFHALWMEANTQSKLRQCRILNLQKYFKDACWEQKQGRGQTNCWE